MEIQKLSVRREHAYEIVLGREIFPQIVAKILRLRYNRQCAVVTNDVVARWYLQPLVAELRSRGFETIEIALPDGEPHKTLDTAVSLYPRLFAAGFDRRSPLIALGGGVIGDLGGFVAATCKRGIPFIQIPTTILAMVDASIGGKVGVNTPEGKNLVGAFYQPALVGIDVATLKTLPLTQVAYGLVEAVKHGAIADAAYYKFILKNREAFQARDLDLLQRLVRRSVHIKKEIVEADELEQGPRAVLNFGHTFGHAFELLGGFRRLHHGEAVGLGMLSALAVARGMGILKEDYTASLSEFLTSFSLPTTIPREWSIDAIIQAMVQDKKRSSDSLTLVLPTSLGRVELVPCPFADLPRLLTPLRQLAG
ncbi:MAG: 3-dehydroquinate synthase [Candidatus Riflebacteria bacterium]|nr:3-dehydroquinate synthase [Candidatus Riflebacteria bacterium]